MIYHKIIINGKDAIDSSSITSFKRTSSVNEGKDLTLGSTCSACIEFSARSNKKLKSGDKLELFESFDGKDYLRIGIFFAESIKKVTDSTFSVTAFDSISKFEKDIARNLRTVNFPITLFELAKKVCGFCGVTCANNDIPGSEFVVKEFKADSIKARTVIKWIGQISGTFCKAVSDGRVYFTWYAVRPEKAGPIDSAKFYQGTFKRSEFAVFPIDQVSIKETKGDIGITYPDNVDGGNTYSIIGNKLLSGATTESILTIAERLQGLLSTVTYLPVSFSGTSVLHNVVVGDIITIKVADKFITTYAMKVVESGSKYTVSSVGSRRRDDVSATANESFSSLNYKTLEIEKNVDGVKITAKSAEEKANKSVEKVSELTQTVDNVSAEVKKVTTDTETVKTELSSLTVGVGKIEARVSQNESTANELSTRVTQTESSIKNEVVKREGGSEQSFSWQLLSGGWILKGNGKNVMTVNKDGAYIKGEIVADSGTIGGYTIGTNSLIGTSGSNKVYIKSPSPSDNGTVFAVQVGTDYPFVVKTDGSLKSTKGTVGGYTIGENSLVGESGTNKVYLKVPDGAKGTVFAVRVGDKYPFVIKSDGSMTANSGTFKGDVYAGKVVAGKTAGYISSGQVSSGINTKLGYAQFSDDVFNNRLSATHILSSALTCSGNAAIGQAVISNLFFNGFDVDWIDVGGKWVLGRKIGKAVSEENA